MKRWILACILFWNLKKEKNKPGRERLVQNLVTRGLVSWPSYLKYNFLCIQGCQLQGVLEIIARQPVVKEDSNSTRPIHFQFVHQLFCITLFLSPCLHLLLIIYPHNSQPLFAFTPYLLSSSLCSFCLVLSKLTVFSPIITQPLILSASLERDDSTISGT